MKLGFLAATALVSSTIISTPAFADTVTPPTADAADGVTLAAMQSQCDALAAALKHFLLLLWYTEQGAPVRR